MNILVVGFYGVLNAGDDLLQNSLTWLFREHRLTFTRILPQQDAIQQYDLLVIGGGSIWPQHPFFINGEAYARSLRIPYMVLGISAKSFDIDAANRTRKVIDNAIIFHVRDRQTAEWLDHPKVFVGSDLFWSVPWFGDLNSKSVADSGIAFSPRSSQASTWPIADCTQGLSMFGKVLPWPFFYGYPRHDGAELNDAELLRTTFKDVPPSFSFQPLFESSAVFTMRYHGIMCGLRAGRPILVGDVHNKLGNFCREHQLDAWHVKDISMLESRARAMLENYAHERKIALQIRRKLLQSGSELANELQKCTSSIPIRRFSRARQQMVNGLRNILSKIS